MPLFELSELGDTAENGSGWWYHGDSMRITVERIGTVCDAPNSTLIFSYPPASVYYLTNTLCADSGRTFMRYAFLTPNDSTSFGFTTAYFFGGYGTGNLRWGKYPKYWFALRDDGYGSYGDVIVRADVFPCNLTGDSLLDVQAIRDSMKAAFARSNADSTPNSLKRKEVGGVIYRHTDSTGAASYYLKEISTYITQTACRNTWSMPTPNAPGDVPIATFHTHPSIQGDTVYGCGPGTQQFPGDTGKVAIAGNHYNAGGGSPADWGLADNSGAPTYTMGKDSVVWRLDPNVLPANRPNNTHHWRWKKFPGGCRGW